MEPQAPQPKERTLALRNTGAIAATLDPEAIASLVISGDLKRLNDSQKVAFYNYRCQQAGLSPEAKPFDLLTLNGKQILYANAGCTQQLTAIHKLSHRIVSKEVMNGLFVVGVQVTGPDGRSTENMAAVSVEGLKGEAACNAMMKATTKAIRRTVLAHCGLGMLDETEVDSIPAEAKIDYTDGQGGTVVTAGGGNFTGEIPEVMKPLPQVPEEPPYTDLQDEDDRLMYEAYIEAWGKTIDACETPGILLRLFKAHEERMSANSDIMNLLADRKKQFKAQEQSILLAEHHKDLNATIITEA